MSPYFRMSIDATITLTDKTCIEYTNLTRVFREDEWLVIEWNGEEGEEHAKMWPRSNIFDVNITATKTPIKESRTRT